MAELAIAGFLISRLDAAQKHATSLKNRFSKFRKNPEIFANLRDSLSRLDMHVAHVRRIVDNSSGPVPGEISVLFNDTFCNVCDTLNSAHSTMDKTFSKVFVASHDSKRSKILPKLNQVARANELNDEMKALQSKIDINTSQLHHLIGVLSSALKVEQNQTVVTSKIDHVQSTLDVNQTVVTSRIDRLQSTLDNLPSVLQAVQRAHEVFVSAFNAPAPTYSIVLDFDSKDKSGNHATPEGKLKQFVLHGELSKPVTVVSGAIEPAHSVLGMAGVGKTVALQRLGRDEDVKNYFEGGVYFMSFGRDATLQTAIREIVKIVELTGASSIADNVRSCTSLKDAVDHAAKWFDGKICLYLLDDLWPTKNLPPENFNHLRQLLRTSPRSRMAISTRFESIAMQAGFVVDFAPRDPLGSTAVNMFFAHAMRTHTQGSSAEMHHLRPSVSKILAICAGLPISLAVTGSAVAKLVRVFGTLEKACDEYAVKLEKRRMLLGLKDRTYGSSLNAALLISLEYLDDEFPEWASDNSIDIENSASELYTSFCVLPNQAWVPLSVLSRLWMVDEDVSFDIVNLFCEMSLAKLESRKSPSGALEEVGLILHDTQLEFCQKRAKEIISIDVWHTRLLDGYLDTSTQSTFEKSTEELVEKILNLEPRPWWSKDVPEDGYIHTNLCRHLVNAGRGLELAALLLRAEWTERQGRVGGILALKTDFEALGSYLTSQDIRIGEVINGFQTIFKVVQLLWGRMADGLRVFQFHICGRLVTLRKSSSILGAYVRSVEQITPKPYLVPLNSFFPKLESAMIMEIPVGGECWCVAFSPCWQYFASGAGYDVVVARASDGEILKRLKGHNDYVTCITFSVCSSKVVSGSWDNKVIVWEWEMSDISVLVLEGSESHISGVAISTDGTRIFSGSLDGTVRIWDMNSGTELSVLSQDNPVCSIAISGDGQKIAFGSGNGTLKVLDVDTTVVVAEKVEAHDSRIEYVRFSPSGSYLATASLDRTVRLWSAQTWTRIGEAYRGHHGLVTCVSFSPDEKRVASCARDGIRLWDVESGVCIGTSPKLASSIRSASFAADGDRIVSGSDDSIVRIWDARLGSERKSDSAEVRGVAISQNGLQVAFAWTDGTVQLWDTDSGEQIGPPLQGHTQSALCVSFSPDGGRLVSGSSDATVRQWDTNTFSQIGPPLEGHTGRVQSVSFSADGQRIVSGGSDGTIRIWNARTHEQIGDALHALSTISSCVSESDDGCHIVARDSNKITVIWSRISRAAVWTSNSESEKCITDAEAENVIRRCGQQTPHLWPICFPPYSAELYIRIGRFHSNLVNEETVMAEFPYFVFWKFHNGARICAFGVDLGNAAICKLITK